MGYWGLAREILCCFRPDVYSRAPPPPPFLPVKRQAVESAGFFFAASHVRVWDLESWMSLSWRQEKRGSLHAGCSVSPHCVLRTVLRWWLYKAKRPVTSLFSLLTDTSLLYHELGPWEELRTCWLDEVLWGTFWGFFFFFNICPLLVIIISTIMSKIWKG